MEFLQHPQWYGTPVDLGDWFVLTKERRTARCVIRTHQFGWEMCLRIGSQQEEVRTHVCRTQEDVLTTGEQWMAAMVEEGWGRAPSGP